MLHCVNTKYLTWSQRESLKSKEGGVKGGVSMTTFTKKLCHHELLKAEKSISTYNHAQRVTVNHSEEEEEEEGKNKSEYKMKNDSMFSFCDSSHWVADPTPGLNQRLQPKISTVVTKKRIYHINAP